MENAYSLAPVTFLLHYYFKSYRYYIDNSAAIPPMTSY